MITDISFFLKDEIGARIKCYFLIFGGHKKSPHGSFNIKNSRKD